MQIILDPFKMFLYNLVSLFSFVEQTKSKNKYETNLKEMAFKQLLGELWFFHPQGA